MVLAALLETPYLTDLRSSLGRGYPEIHIRLDRDSLALRGLDARSVADAVRQKVQGLSPTALRNRDRRIEGLC